ncbi:S-adenosylhomocysteine deaminase [Solidesulfovibrio carbinoliphilus subsp. oakridgensis]|uniref:S-adenosylhomocysteine deaminase n=1 Tax=Solidesulfovibrio carbinoliphilus subsp. oakridgensis TaxID=694327 RepID=G7Q564_9BACT|nr:amidohydrolase family protein [Solidesulfovibrio carbinoliphilus]EHJ48387.1 S-adenosylhomocysteine deaminase [Solidesulfovibrio carbinoliphilus subsp. oakridgensis]
MPHPARPRAVTARLMLPMIPGAGRVDDAAVLFAGRRILAAGPRRQVLGDFSGPVEDLGDAVLVPGLINAHVHLELSGLGGQSPRGAGFPAWAAWLAGRDLSPPPAAVLAAAVRRMAATGTAGVIDVGSRAGPAVVAALAAQGLSGLVCHEYIGFRRPPADLPPVLPPALEAAVRQAPGVRAAPSGHALYSTSPDSLRRAREACRRLCAPFCLHVAETAGEVALLATGTGELAALFRGRLVPKGYRPPGRTPVAEALSLGLLGPDALAVHAVWLSGADRRLLAETGTAVCLCPRSNRHIGVGTADAPALFAAGVPLCLGTDSLASNDDLDLWNEVRALLADHPDFPGQALLPALTTTPARLLGRDRELGLLAPGAVGGYAVIPPDLAARLA